MTDRREFADTANPDLPWQEQVDMVMDAPGDDPVAAAIENTVEDMVATGYLISATLVPGGEVGSIDVVRYSPGNIEFSPAYDRRELYGSASVPVKITESSGTTILVGAPEPKLGYYTAGNRELVGADATAASIGENRFVVGRNQPQLWTGRSASYRTLRYNNPYQCFSPATDLQPLYIERIVEEPEEVDEVLTVLGQGMGLTDDALEVFVVEAGKRVRNLPLMAEEAAEQVLPSRLTAVIGSLGGLVSRRTRNR